MTGAERRAQLKAQLSTSTSPISATMFAKQFGVSRQTIVGDISLLRANGVQIVATLRGYQVEDSTSPTAVLVCRHFPNDTADEMQRIIQAGGVIKDVAIEHPLYGQLRGELEIGTLGDLKLFLARVQQHQGHLLSELTDGLHTHTIAYDTPTQLAAIKTSLKAAGYLYQS
ncbi:transcription repressor NadR [Lactiplantibacillus daowaiensis]|uniref:Transcription repressor NadR n=1 Tax=Lactiplantibacillus daowaiensis TaxID=2559918 RepID=A0ABW1RYK6_9LACO|nr:transcription repressor NadR [Lactiplantibacillus daowaiensis]